MGEPEVYLEKLSAFSRILRMEGLSVSPKETEDASRLLITLGLDDRQRVKTALRTVYAKSREEQITFDRVFDGFFLSEEQIRRQAEEEKRRQRLAEAKADLDDTIAQNISQLENQNLLTIDQVTSADSCQFETFADDLADQNAAVKQAVRSQGAADQARQLKRQQERLKCLDNAIDAISQAIRNQD